MNNKINKSKYLSLVIGKVLLLTLFGQSIAHANDLSIGAGALIKQPAYKDYDRQIYPMPVINYENRYVFVKGLSLGAYVINTDNHKLYAAIAYLPNEFKTSKTDNHALKQLDNRKASIMSGIGYTHHANWGNFYTHVLTEISGNSHGTIADIAYGYSFQFDKLYIEPKIGVEWQNRKFNDYYFGISQSESNRSGLAYHSADSGSTPYLAMNVHYAFNHNWQAFLYARYSRLSHTIKDSPMTSRSSTSLVGTGIMYCF